MRIAAKLTRFKGIWCVDINRIAIGFIEDDLFAFVAAHIGGEAVIPSHLTATRRRKFRKRHHLISITIVKGGGAVNQFGVTGAVPADYL